MVTQPQKNPKKTRVLVIDDSAFYRQAMNTMLSKAPDIEVVGSSRDGADAIMLVTKHRPDVITLDLEMPKVDGYVFLRWLMKNHPIPVIVVSSLSDQGNVFKALELGAVDFLTKPTPRASWEILEINDDLLVKVREAATISVEKLMARAAASMSAKASMIPSTIGRGATGKKSRQIELVAIGASTGGPTAIQSILGRLPAEFPTPLLVTQHMPPGFTQYFAERLNKLSPLSVSEAKHGDLLETSHAYVCPGGYHMHLRRAKDGIRVLLQKKIDSDRYVPSVDQMFSSAADAYPGRVLGVILTGMGNDGRLGMKKIKMDGGQTVAESEETAVVFGMPKEAIAEGVVDRILPLPQIYKEIIRRVSG